MQWRRTSGRCRKAKRASGHTRTAGRVDEAGIPVDGQLDWLPHHVGGEGFTLLLLAAPFAPTSALGLRHVFVTATPQAGALCDHAGLVARRYDAQPGGTILFRLDQHVAARRRRFDPAAIAAACASAGVVSRPRDARG